MDNQLAAAKKQLQIFEKDFLKELSFLADPRNEVIMQENFFATLERSLSSDSKFYSKQDLKAKWAKDALVTMTGSINDMNTCKQVSNKYYQTPLGIFSFIPNTQASDIFIVAGRITFTNTGNHKIHEIIIPRELIKAYNSAVDRLITLTTYSAALSKSKFDPSNAILDYESEKLRFNVVHSSLNASKTGRPIIVLRNQLLDTTNLNKQQMQEFHSKYMSEQKLKPEQEKFINELATNGSFIIFGETGSGKTTLLKYMGNYNLHLKRNLITIEDTSELFLPVNITYLTNDKHNIQDLFKVTLRENPSHVLIGETRSIEIKDILESGLVFRVGTTLHADSLEKLIMRIIFLIKSGSNDYASEDVQRLITATCDGFIWMKDRQIKQIWKRKDNVTKLEDVLDNYEKI